MIRTFIIGLLAGIAAATAAWMFLPRGILDSVPWPASPFANGEQPERTLAAKDGAMAPPAVAVKAMRAEVTRFVDTVEAIGTLRANESVAVTSPVADIVSKIHFDDGQRVKEGQVLVEMTTSEERALLEEAKSTLAEARSQYERSKGLAERKITAETILDQRLREFETARARLTAMEARIADRIIRAPFSGVVGLRTVSVGAHVSPGAAVASIEDDSVMKLDFSVPSTFLTTLQPGLDVVATARGFEGETFKGSVESVDNRVDDATRTIRVRALIPNPDRRLKPGLLMTVDLLKRPRQAVTIAEGAVVPLGTEKYVFVINDETKTVERRRIMSGARRLGEIEVLEGLSAGELVVVEGTLKLRPGAAVEIQEIESRPDGSAQGETGLHPGGKS